MSTMTASMFGPFSSGFDGGGVLAVRSACSRRTGARVARAPPARHERRELGRSVLPDEVPDVDRVELAVGQPLVEKLGVDRRHRRIMCAGEDLYRRLYSRQQISEDWKLRRVGAHVAHRLDEAVTVIGG